MPHSSMCSKDNNHLFWRCCFTIYLQSAVSQHMPHSSMYSKDKTLLSPTHRQFKSGTGFEAELKLCDGIGTEIRRCGKSSALNVTDAERNGDEKLSRTHARTCARAYTHTHTHTRACASSLTRARALTHTHICTHSHGRACVCTCVCVCVHLCVNA